MGVQLNIKDPETVRLARELAGRTGQSLTYAIRSALVRELQEHEEILRTRHNEIIAATDRFQRHISDEWRGKEMSWLANYLLYEDDGLPG
ncbi:type II toxin-antitoxin system VapB family antitoxin [uncultured Sphingomonas sp.]|uniref:type II toxin-antitoxin system VapB family antitoxin n=1 Tax=uncultured Sphingomonas sp. TaxID=158754 RepID=UPI0035CB42EF